MAQQLRHRCEGVELVGMGESEKGVRYLEVKISCKNALGPRIVSAVQSLEAVASRRLPMNYKYGIFNP